MIEVAPNSRFEAILEDAPPGITTLGVQIVDPTAHAVITPRTQIGISEFPAGVYSVQLNAPSVVGDYLVVWDIASALPNFTEQLVVTTARTTYVNDPVAPPNGTPVCIAGQTFTATFLAPPDTATGGLSLGARVEVPVTRAIASSFHLATRSGDVWSVTLDSPLDPGSYDLVWMTPDDPATYISFLPLTCVSSGEASGASPNWPSVDTTAVTPDVDSVARLLRTRTKTIGGEVKATFDDTTIVKAAEVTATINDARQLILGQLAEELDPELYPRIKYAVTLQAAILIEASFFRTQEGQAGGSGLISTYTKLLSATLANLTPGTGRYVGLS